MDCTVCHHVPATHLALASDILHPRWDATTPVPGARPVQIAEFCEACAVAVATSRNDKIVPPHDEAESQAVPITPPRAKVPTKGRRHA